MRSFFKRSRKLRVLAPFLILALAGHSYARAQGQAAVAPGDAQVARAVGTIKSVRPDSITLASDSGVEVTATLASSTRILRVASGQSDLKNATALQAQDLQPGDRVLVRGRASADGHSIAALSIMVMKQADVSAKQERDREDWQKRGVGGLVTAVDGASGAITISSAGLGANPNVTVHTNQNTVARRYAADSVRFDDAKPAPLDQIKPGDQLRARGVRNADSSEVTAEEIVSGTFRNIAGTITAIDPASNSMTVQDAIGKKTVVVKVSADSQIKKLPAEMAQRIALRVKGGAAGNGEPGTGHPGAGTQGAKPAGDGSAPEAGGQFSRGPGGGERGNGPPDLQRFLSRMPASKLADLQKGDAVMIVSTQGADSGAVTAITLLAGVEPILTASPGRSSSMLLSPWTLSGSSGETESAP
jgi:hypothetical protein